MPRLLFATLILTLAAHAAAQGRIICWTDDDGRRACGDRVPPGYADRERKIYDERGNIVETQARQKTPEERAAEARERRAQQQARAEAEEQGRYDSFLLQAYDSVDGIVAARDDRVRVVNGRLELLNKQLADSEQALQELKLRVERLVADGKPVPARLEAQVAEFEETLAQQREAQRRTREERRDIVENFARDAARYGALRGLAPQEIPPPPALDAGARAPAAAN